MRKTNAFAGLFRSVVFALMMLCGSAAHAQAPDILPPFPHPEFVSLTGLTVHGHAEIKAKPDVAYANVGVTTQARDQADAIRENAAKTNAVIAQLKKSGIASDDIQTQYYTVQPQYDYNASPPVRTGYQVTNIVRVTVRDLSKSGVILDQATQAGATDVNDITFDLTNRTQVETQALTAAVQNARIKADAMAAAGGVGLGRLLNLTEGAAPIIQPIYGMRAMAAKAAPEPTPIAPQQITVNADVTATYALGLPTENK